MPGYLSLDILNANAIKDWQINGKFRVSGNKNLAALSFHYQ